MHKTVTALLSLAAVSLLVSGCAGPEQKLGRGLTNMGEIVRGGSFRRSFEQTTVFGNSDAAYTTGAIKGFDRGIARTFSGLYEVVTFPIPNHAHGDYGPIYHPHTSNFADSINPVYPDSYKPNWIADQVISPDASLGFGGGDIAPFVPGSRFRIFDN